MGRASEQQHSDRSYNLFVALLPTERSNRMEVSR